MPLPSAMDDELFALARIHINAFLRRYLDPLPQGRILEIGPKLKWPIFDTLDIDPQAHATFTTDICDPHGVPSSAYSVVIAISILEHVYDPQLALENIAALTAPGGILLLQTPLNARQHGPQPDLWRFTENGLRYMLHEQWDIEDFDVLDTPERALFPVAYCVMARKRMTPQDAKFRPQWITR